MSYGWREVKEDVVEDEEVRYVVECGNGPSAY